MMNFGLKRMSFGLKMMNSESKMMNSGSTRALQLRTNVLLYCCSAVLGARFIYMPARDRSLSDVYTCRRLIDLSLMYIHAGA